MQITIPELLIKGIPEGFLSILSIYVLTKTKIDLKKYIIQSVVTIIVIYLIRFLPINYGINSILALTFFAIYFAIFNKMEFAKVIKAAIITIMIIFISEFINVIGLKLIFGSEETKKLFEDPLKKCLCSIPSTLFFALGVYISSIVMKKIESSRRAKNGETGTKTGE